MTVSVSKRLRLSVMSLVAVGLACGAMVMLGWMVDETHFDRPDEGFDELAAQMERLPGVSVDAKERWVEAPTFSNPTSWMGITTVEAGLGGAIRTLRKHVPRRRLLSRRARSSVNSWSTAGI